MSRSAAVTLLLCAGTGAALAGCGDTGPRQDADETAGSYDVRVVSSSFPRRQVLAQPATLKVTVRNADTRAVPNLAITVDSFDRRSDQADLADASRPVWILDSEPAGSGTAYVGTWAFGRLAPGQTRTVTWKVTAVSPGQHTVRYRIAAGLDGKAVARPGEGGRARGSFAVAISDKPAQARVGSDGEVIREP